MLIWQGSFDAVWPGHPSPSLKVQFWTSAKLELGGLELKFSNFCRTSHAPLDKIRGPQCNVYSDDERTIEYFGELKANDLGLVASCAPTDQYDHFMFYFTGDSVYARPLQLKPRPKSKFQPPINAKPEPPRQKREDLTQLYQQVTLGAMRMRGYQRDDDFKTRYSLCYKATEFSFRNSNPNLEQVKERVEMLLSMLG